MIRVQYFARYREVLGIDGEQLQRAALSNLEQLREHLQAGGWTKADDVPLDVRVKQHQVTATATRTGAGTGANSTR